MRNIENIEEVEIDGNEYDAVDMMEFNNRTYMFLINKVNREDMMCLRATLNEKLELEELDDEEELNNVMKLFFEKHREELEN